MNGKVIKKNFCDETKMIKLYAWLKLIAEWRNKKYIIWEGANNVLLCLSKSNKFRIDVHFNVRCIKLSSGLFVYSEKFCTSTCTAMLLNLWVIIRLWKFCVASWFTLPSFSLLPFISFIALWKEQYGWILSLFQPIKKFFQHAARCEFFVNC